MRTVLGVFEALGGEVGLLHVERLVSKVIDLILILLLLFQNSQGLLLHSVFAWPIPHLRHLLFVLGELLVQPRNLFVHGLCPTVDLE